MKHRKIAYLQKAERDIKKIQSVQKKLNKMVDELVENLEIATQLEAGKKFKDIKNK